MKKVILLIIASLILPIMSFAQKDHIAIQANYFFVTESGFGADAIELTGIYMRDVSKIFHIGAGFGFGFSNVEKYKSWAKMDNINAFEDEFYIPLFIRAKIDFSRKPSHLYGVLKIGKNLGGVKGFDGEKFNPYGIMVNPGIGYNFSIGEQKICVEMSINAQHIKYQYLNYEYSDIFKEYRYKNFENDGDLVALAGISLLFQF